MTRRTFFSIIGAVVVATLIGAYYVILRGDVATLPVAADVGPSPVLPAPKRTLIPTVNIAPARGWPVGGKPTAAGAFLVTAYARGLDHPRWLYVLPNGDVLVAETRPHGRVTPRGSGV